MLIYTPYDDVIVIRARGQGLQLLDYPDIRLLNLGPTLLTKMGIEESGDGRIRVPVTTRVPAACMGSGLGAAHAATGDYDVMTGDPESVRRYQLDRMRFGDFVALLDHDNSFGRDYRQGAVTIGIVVHSDCLRAGHGPGIATLMTCATPLIEPVIEATANIAERLHIGSRREAE